MAYTPLRVIATQEIWTGQPVNGYRSPLNIGDLYNDEQLAAIGLEKIPAPTPQPPAPYVPEPQDVKDEAQRRIIVLMQATDITDCLIKQNNAIMRAVELVNKKAENGVLTPEEVAEEAALEALVAYIKHIRTKSNEIEALDPIPSDFTQDSYWV